jgi:hypothetical protein
VSGGAKALDATVREAGSRGGVVLLVISDPLWCLSCAELHQRWLDAPDETELASLTRDVEVLLLNPSEEPDAEALARHRVLYQGVPSVLAFAPDGSTRLLGEARVIGGLVGSPPDFPQRLATILSSRDDLVGGGPCG